jgi:hypothetical protein
MPANYGGGSQGPTRQSILHQSALSAGWVYRSAGPGGSVYTNPTTGRSQRSTPLPSGWSTINTPAGTKYKSTTGRIQSELPTSAATGPVTLTGASGPSGGVSARRGPSETLVSQSAGGDGVTEAQLQRRRRGRVQTNLTGGAASMANLAQKTLVGI